MELHPSSVSQYSTLFHAIIKEQTQQAVNDEGLFLWWGCLPSVHEALGSILSTEKKQK